MKNYISQQDMKQANLWHIFSSIRANGALTRKQLAELTDMSWGAVSKITAELLEKGYLTESKAEARDTAGPIPSYLEVDTTQHFSIGLDINHSGLRGGLINLKNEVVRSFQCDAAFTDRETLLATVLAFVKDILNGSEGRHILCIGVAMQGIVDAEAGVSLYIPGKMKAWKDVPLAQLIEAETGIPTHIEHDPSCILYAACPDQEQDAILIRADQGIGMSARMGGRIIDKPGIFEIGHVTAVPDGLPCACGKRGCLDQYSSIQGIEKRSGQRFEALCRAASLGDADAKRYLDEAAAHLAVAVGNISHMLVIDRIILCGELWSLGAYFWDVFCSMIRKNQCTQELRITLFDVANAPLGAAMIASELALTKIN